MSYQGKRWEQGRGQPASCLQHWLEERGKGLLQVRSCFWVRPPLHAPVSNQKLVLNAN